VVNNLDEIKSYFIGLGTDECANIICDFIWSDDRDFTLNELYLHFSHQYMRIFHEIILKLENSDMNSTDLYDIMNDIKTKLENRIKHNFFGNKANKNLYMFTLKEQNNFRKAALIAYQRALKYLGDNFDFEKSIFKEFSAINLENDLNYESLIIISKSLNININGDQLFDECCNSNSILSKFSSEDRNLKSSEKWCKLFSLIDIPNILKIVETVLAIPIGNDFVERIFSIMHNLWSDERNRLSVKMVKAEICTKVNYSMTCSEFKNFVANNTKFINAAKSTDKYSFK
jgi:hypothetical protein